MRISNKYIIEQQFMIAPILCKKMDVHKYTALIRELYHYLGLLLVVALGIVDTVSETTEYCQTEVFTAECGPGSLIMITSASYGRMHIGRCVLTDYGSVGCSEDVLFATDRMCSGLHSCSISVPHAHFEALQPCPGEFKNFLEISYECIAVATPSHDICRIDNGVTMSSYPGYISDVISHERGVGTVPCPWKIQLSPGQRINLTLYDFAQPTLRASDFQDYTICHQYVLITEKTAVMQNHRVCGGDERVKHIYTSRSHTLEIRIVQTANSIATQREPQHFMIKYDAIGCPLPTAPYNGWWRYGRDGEAIFGCNHTDVSWYKQCVGTTWQGNSQNCTEELKTGASGMVKWGNLSMPYGVSLGIIVGLAVIIGVIILLVGLICMEWKKMKRAQNKNTGVSTELMISGKTFEHDPYNKNVCRTHNNGASTLLPPPPPQCAPTRHNEYAYSKDRWSSLQQTGHTISCGNHVGYHDTLSPVGNIADMSTDSEEDGGNYKGHIYESPKSMRRGLQNGQAVGIAPQYFEMEHSVGGHPRNAQNIPPCYVADVNEAVITNANAAVLVDFNRI